MTLSPRRPFVRLVLASALLAGLWGCQRDRGPSEPPAVAPGTAVDSPENVDEVVSMLVREAMRQSNAGQPDPGGEDAPTHLATDHGR